MGFKLEHVMRAFALYERKPLHKRGASLGALRNLINSYAPREDIADDDALQILAFLDGQDFGLREMALLTMKQLCIRENNAFKLLFHDTVPKLVLCLELETMADHHESVAFALEQIVSHPSLMHWWDDVMKKGGFTSVMSHVQPHQPLLVRYACACVLRALAQYQCYAMLIINHAMPLVTNFKSMNSDFQEVYTELMSKLMLHADDHTVSLLNVDALPSSLNMLQQGPCCVQQQALMLISSLAESNTGLTCILQDSNTIPMVLSAMINTECRKTRQNAALAVSKITSCPNATSQKQFLLHVDKFHHETEDKLDSVSAEEDGMKLRELSKVERLDRAVADFGKDLVNLIHKLGKMEQDLLGNITDIRLAPCIDTDVCDLSTLCHVLQVLSNLVHFSANQIKLHTFEQEHSSQSKFIKTIKQSLEVNYKLCQILIQQHILCIADLLSVYTQKLLDIISICSKPLKCMNGMSKSQILFQAWGSQSDAMSAAGKINVTSLFDSNEVEVIVKILEVLNILSFSTTAFETENSTLESKISEKIFNHNQTFSTKPMTSSSKSKKKKKHFHSKAACELCQKIDKTLPSAKTLPKSPRNQKSLKPKDSDKKSSETSSQPPCQCTQVSSEETESFDVLEDEFKLAFRKQMAKQQRDVRIALYEAGVVESVGPWLLSSDTRHQTLVVSILRNMVQPVQEMISPTPPKQAKLNSVGRTRSLAVNMTAKERDQAMDIALYQMSSRMKQFIEEALGRRIEPPHNTPRDLKTVPDSAARLNRENSKFRNGENAWRKVSPSRNVDRANSNSNLSDLSDKTYKPEDYNRFARLNASRPNSAISRPDSGISSISGNSSKTGASLRSNSYTRLSSARHRPRRQSVSPKRTRRPASAVSSTKPVNGYQVFVKPPSENENISVSKCIEKLSSSSSESMGDNREITAENFPSAIYDLDRPRSRLGSVVSDKGHRCDRGARPRSTSCRGRARERQNSAISEIENLPIGQRYPKRVWIPWKPQLQTTQSVAEQCRCLVAMVTGKVLLQQVFAKDQQLRKDALDFMDQYIKHGQVGSHMKMSEQGIMPRMVVFLRINEDDLLLEMMGLSVVGQLLKSDRRLVEVFDKHGGTDLLVSMATCTSGPLKQHVAHTLHVVTSADYAPNKRVMSAPVRRNKQPDIWDKILHRWKQEDKVVKDVLTKFKH